MAFSSRRRNYLLTPHRKDGLIEWMKSMLNHSFVLDALESTAADTFSHFEMLIDEHRQSQYQQQQYQSQSTNGDASTNGYGSGHGSGHGHAPPSRLKQLVPTVGTFHTRLPLRKAFVAYNKKYALTKRKHISISFNELRHILNLAQIMALRTRASANASANANGVANGIADEDGIIHYSHHDDEEEDHDLRVSLQKWETSPGALHMDRDYIQSGGKLQEPPSPPSMTLGDAMITTSSTTTNNTTTTTTKTTNILSPAMTTTSSSSTSFHDSIPFKGPKMITFDGDQTLYSDGANFESNPELANYLYLLLRHGVTLAVVTAAGYEYSTDRYEMRLSGLLAYFKMKKLPASDCERFYLFGGECNYLLVLGDDYKLHPVKEHGAGGWITATKHLQDAPGNWKEEKIQSLLDVAQNSIQQSTTELKIRGRVIRKKRSIGLIPTSKQSIPREALDESVLRVQDILDEESSVTLPFCAFNGGRDVWVDVGNKRVGVHILATYLGMPPEETLHIGDQFLNTGNDFAARDICACIWITSPDETTYILKSTLRLANVSLEESSDLNADGDDDVDDDEKGGATIEEEEEENKIDFSTVDMRHSLMDVYTGEIIGHNSINKGGAK